MKKLLLIAMLLLALVVTAVACTNDDKPAADTTVAETTGNADPGETTDKGDETSSKAEETTAEPETTEGVTTEAVTEDPDAPVAIWNASDIEMGGPVVDVDQTNTMVLDDFLNIITDGPDPYFFPIGVYNTGARYVSIKYRTSSAGESCAMQIYLASQGNAPIDDATLLEEQLVIDGEWHLAIFDTQGLIDAGHYDGWLVSYFRLDPLNAGISYDENGEVIMIPHPSTGEMVPQRDPLPEGAEIDIAYIAFFNSEEAANKYEYGEVIEDETGDETGDETDPGEEVTTDNTGDATDPGEEVTTDNTGDATDPAEEVTTANDGVENEEPAA